MIDTIKIKLSKFKILPNHNLKEKNIEIIENKNSSKSTLNKSRVSRKYNELSGDFENIYVRIPNNKSLFIDCSLPKIFSDLHNLYPLNKFQIIQTLNKINKILLKNGVKTNVFNGTLCRLDLCKNIQLKYEFHTYDKLLILFRPEGREENSFYWISKPVNSIISTEINKKKKKKSNSCFIVYDKTKEIRENQKYHTEENDIARFEYRMLNTNKVITDLKFNTIKEVIKNYKQLNILFNKKFKKIFRNNSFDNSPYSDYFHIKVKNLQNVYFQSFNTNGKDKKLNEFFKLFGIFSCSQLAPEQFNSFISAVTKNRKTANIYKKHLMEAEQFFLKNSIVVNGFKTKESIGNLFNEIFDKIIYQIPYNMENENVFLKSSEVFDLY